jgi:hypothetical protein
VSLKVLQELTANIFWDKMALNLQMKAVCSSETHNKMFTVFFRQQMLPQHIQICYDHLLPHLYLQTNNKLLGLSSQSRTIPTERPPLVSEVSANFSG